MVALETLVDAHSRNYLLGHKILAHFLRSYTLKVRPVGQIL